MKNILLFFKRELTRGMVLNNQKLIVLLVFIFVFFCLALFQPYTIKQYDLEPRLFVVFCYSICSCLGTGIVLGVKKIHKKERWTKWNEAVTVFQMIFLIWIIGYLFTIFVLDGLLQKIFNNDCHAIIPPDFLLHGLLEVFMVGAIVYFLLRLYDITYIISSTNRNNNYKTPSNYKQIIDNNSKIKLIGRNKGEIIELKHDKLTYIKSEGHYVKIHYLNDDDIQESILLRATLGSIEKSTSLYNNFYRCHKSYIVNLNYLKSIISDSNKCFGYLENNLGKISISKKVVRQIKGMVYSN